MAAENPLAFADEGFLPLSQQDAELIASLWIGNQTLVSCHYNAQSNLACCVAGQCRVTLFPPQQIDNLYPGALEPTPGGQIAELQPGDALFLPGMWWHQVEAFSPSNILLKFLV